MASCMVPHCLAHCGLELLHKYAAPPGADEDVEYPERRIVVRSERKLDEGEE